MPSGTIRNLELPKLVRTLAAPKMQKQPSILGQCWHTSCCLVQALPELELTRRHGVKGLSGHRLDRKKKAKANSTLRKIIPQAQFVCGFWGDFGFGFFFGLKMKLMALAGSFASPYSTSGHK